MEPNPVLKKLGLSSTDRVAIIHTDDIGMCQASVTAFTDLWDFGLITSGATMVPCPWFPEAARYCKNNPEVDMGVHLTLTSEWETYRWGPVSSRDKTAGLMDAEGFFPRTSAEIQSQGDSNAVALEIQTQVARAKQAGIIPSHIDTHMGSIFHAPYIPSYSQLAIQEKIPPMMIRATPEDLHNRGFEDENLIQGALALIAYLESENMPLLDHIFGMPLHEHADIPTRVAYAKKAVDDLQPGITHFILHPSFDTPELRAITPDWPFRVADYHTFLSKELRDHFDNQGIHRIGYKDLQKLIP